MTQPISNLMPYAATLLPQAGVDAMQVLESHRNWGGSGRSTILALPNCVSQISASYNGPQALIVHLRYSDGSRTEITRVEEGSGWRRSPIVSLPVISAGEGLQIFLSSAASTHDEAKYRGSVMVVPTPTPNPA